MTANNETGVIQPMREISHICRERGVLASQRHGPGIRENWRLMSLSSMPPVLPRTNFTVQRAQDFFFCGAACPSSQSCSAAPTKTSGAPEQRTSPQSREWLRPPNGNCATPKTEQQREAQLSDELWQSIAKVFPDAQQNGDPAHRLVNTLNISFIGVDSETMLMALDLEGVCASSGSACMVGSVRASHVLLAMGLPMETRPFGHSFFAW